MNNRPVLALMLLVFVVTCYRCGTNLSGPTLPSSLEAPRNLQAESLDQSSVRLQWSPPAADSLVQSYVIQWGARVDTVSKTASSYTVRSLSVGSTTFIVRSLSTTGGLSTPVSIVWAPAARFEGPYVVSEFNLQDPTTSQGLDVGTQTTDPSTFPVDQSAAPSTDLLLFGGGSKQIPLPLSLWSPALYQNNFNQTKFSTVTSNAPSLDLPLSSFPDVSTFTADSVAIVDNTIYYAQVIGDNRTLLYARLHVHIVPGLAFPNRKIEVSISLQRVTNLLFAENTTHYNHGG